MNGSDSSLPAAATALRAGDRTGSRQILIDLVRSNPRLGEAWYLLAQV